MPSKSAPLAIFALGAAAGAGAEYLLDPGHGRRRRHMAIEWSAARVRRGARTARKEARHAGGQMKGLAADATAPGRVGTVLNDPALEAKVESELFRPPDAPKGSVDVNVENGVVYLRGQVDDQARIEELIGRARTIDGIAGVRSLLHLPGEPAPTKR